MVRRAGFASMCVSASFVLPAILYWFSVEPGVGSWDVGEMQTVLYILGIAHTTGYPAFVLAGWIFSHAFAVGGVAWRINLLGALYFAGASCTLCAIQIRLGVRPAIALLASLLFATGTIVWYHAIRIDVLSMAVLLAALTLWFLIRWSQDRDDRSLILAGMFVGLSLGDHLVILWTLPSVAVFVYLNRSALRTGQFLLATLAAAVVSICLYAYIPIRSASVAARGYDRTLELGFPSGHPYWDYGHPANLRNFFALVTGAQVHASTSFLGMLNPVILIAGLTHFAAMTLAEFSIVGVILLAMGVWVGWRRQRDVTIYALLACVLIAQFTAAFSAETDPDRYYIVSFALLTPLIGLGLGAILDAFREHLATVARVAVAGGMVALIATGIYRERAVFGWHYDRWGIDYVRRVRADTPDDAVIVAPWVLASPLGYAEYVERSYGDRIVAAGSVDKDGLYLKPVLRTRPVYVVLDRSVPSGFRLVTVDAGDPPVFKLVATGR
jgi:hypothetical protein